MPGIFISYRRESTAAFAGRLFDRLSTKFGTDRTFIDIDMIEPGEDFVEVLERKLADAAALVVLIGRDWLDCKDAHGRPRLENPDDFVRLEVATALRRRVRVIPVLLDGACMPSSQQLPEDLASLSRRQAIEIGHARFHQDVTKLIDALDKLLNPAEESLRRPANASPTGTSRRTVAVVGVSVLALAGVVWYFAASHRSEPQFNSKVIEQPRAEPKAEPPVPRPAVSPQPEAVLARPTVEKKERKASATRFSCSGDSCTVMP